MREDLYVRSMNVGSRYHVYNRGVAKEQIFRDRTDYERFLETLNYYVDDVREGKLSDARRRVDSNAALGSEPQQRIATIEAYCLMPNHFHLVLREDIEGGISRFMRRSLLSYTRYFNTRYSRVGPVFQGTFRFVLIENNEQFLHVTRYIHLNPYVAKLTDNPEEPRWSSYGEYLTGKASRLCDPTMALSLVGSTDSYRAFLTDFASYARDFALIKQHGFEEAE